MFRPDEYEIAWQVRHAWGGGGNGIIKILKHSLDFTARDSIPCTCSCSASQCELITIVSSTSPSMGGSGICNKIQHCGQVLGTVSWHWVQHYNKDEKCMDCCMIRDANFPHHVATVLRGSCQEGTIPTVIIDFDFDWPEVRLNFDHGTLSSHCELFHARMVVQTNT